MGTATYIFYLSLKELEIQFYFTTCSKRMPRQLLIEVNPYEMGINYIIDYWYLSWQGMKQIRISDSWELRDLKIRTFQFEDTRKKSVRTVASLLRGLLLRALFSICIRLFIPVDFNFIVSILSLKLSMFSVHCIAC